MSVEVVVSDNSPDSNTADLVAKYKCRLPINYVHQPHNIGGCRNFIFSVNASKGTYCWIIGDDDMICKGSIAKILSVLTREPSVLGIVCGYSLQKEESRQNIMAGLSQDNVIVFDLPNFNNTNIDERVEKWEDTFFLTNIPALHTSILSCVFSIDLWMQHIGVIASRIPANDIPIHDQFDLLETTFPHASTWARMFIGRPVYVISRPLAYLFYGGQGWWVKWPAIMFTRCLDLADLFCQLGGDLTAVHYYKALILKDSSLHGLVMANDSYTKKIFLLQKFISAQADSKEMWKNLGNLLRSADIPCRSKLHVILSLLSSSDPLRNVYRLLNSQDFSRGSWAHFTLSLLARVMNILGLSRKSQL